MCEWGTSKQVRVKIPADVSCTGKVRWKTTPIDACLAGIVGALQTGNVDMRGSCCGHGRGNGGIMLQDGRELVIVTHANPAEADCIQ